MKKHLLLAPLPALLRRASLLLGLDRLLLLLANNLSFTSRRHTTLATLLPMVLRLNHTRSLLLTSALPLFLPTAASLHPTRTVASAPSKVHPLHLQMFASSPRRRRGNCGNMPARLKTFARNDEGHIKTQVFTWLLSTLATFSYISFKKHKNFWIHLFRTVIAGLCLADHSRHTSVFSHLLELIPSHYWFLIALRFLSVVIKLGIYTGAQHWTKKVISLWYFSFVIRASLLGRVFAGCYLPLVYAFIHFFSLGILGTRAGGTCYLFLFSPQTLHCHNFVHN